MQKIKENINQILLGLLLAAIAIIGAMNKSHLDSLQYNFNHSFDQMWAKLDRVTVFMQQKEESLRKEQSILREELSCIGKEMERQKTKFDIYHPNGVKK